MITTETSVKISSTKPLPTHSVELQHALCSTQTVSIFKTLRQSLNLSSKPRTTETISLSSKMSEWMKNKSLKWLITSKINLWKLWTYHPCKLLRFVKISHLITVEKRIFKRTKGQRRARRSLWRNSWRRRRGVYFSRLMSHRQFLLISRSVFREPTLKCKMNQEKRS